MDRYCVKLLPLGAVAVLVSILSATSLTFVEEINLAATLPHTQIPKWSNGGLVAVQGKDPSSQTIWILQPSQTRSVPFAVPGADATLVYDCDRGPDGTIGVSGSAADAGGRIAGFVGWIRPNETDAHIIRTGLYRPAMVTVAADGTLWAVGQQYTKLSRPPVFDPQAGVIQHFDRSGRVVGSFVSQSTVGNPNLSLARTRNTLRASADRVAWYSTEGRYVEISLDGRLLTDMKVDIPTERGKPETRGLSFALADDGTAFLGLPHLATPPGGGPQIERFGVYVLDRAARKWKSLSLAEQPATEGPGYIYGIEGSRLVMMRGRTTQFYSIGN